MVVMNERKYSVMELVKMLEEALPEGQVVVVGKGESLTDAHKAFLHSLTDCKGGCSCEYPCDKDDCEGCEYQYTEADLDSEREDAYEEGKADGYEEARRENEIDDEQALSDAYDEGYAEAIEDMKIFLENR